MVHADESPAWKKLHARFAMQRITITRTATASAVPAPMRRSRIPPICAVASSDIHHHIAGPYLLRYAQEAAYREDRRRVSNGEQAHSVVRLAMQCRPSVAFCGYWQRSRTA